jgi:hypothetical protein
MPKGHEFSQEVKQLMFHIIDFVESEKNGPVIPLYNVTDRLVKMLDISERSVYRLKHELQHLRQKETKNQSQQQQQTEEKEEAETNVRYLRSRTISLPTFKRRDSSTSVPPAKILCRLHTDSSVSSITHIGLLIPQALPPQKKSKRFVISLKQHESQLFSF